MDPYDTSYDNWHNSARSHGPPIPFWPVADLCRTTAGNDVVVVTDEDADRSDRRTAAPVSVLHRYPMHLSIGPEGGRMASACAGGLI
jgi:hypothetical protein